MVYYNSSFAKQRGGIARILLVILLVMVVGAGSGLGVYFWQQRNVTDLKQQVAALNSQIAKLEKHSPSPAKTPLPTN
jgi:uncharacterized protein HemX